MSKLRRGIDRNIAVPGPFAAENLKDGEAGRFFDDYCNWQRIPEFREVIATSPAAQVAAELMQSRTAQVFHDHVLVKEPGTSKPTRQDGPYYFVEGRQTVSSARQTRWSQACAASGIASLGQAGAAHAGLSEENFYPDPDAYMPVPDDAEGMTVLEWPMAPGDAVAFNFHTLHGPAATRTRRRRAFSLRLVGDDARYVARPGRTSALSRARDGAGQKLREDWFPKSGRRKPGGRRP